MVSGKEKQKSAIDKVDVIEYCVKNGNFSVQVSPLDSTPFRSKNNVIVRAESRTNISFIFASINSKVMRRNCKRLTDFTNPLIIDFGDSQRFNV